MKFGSLFSGIGGIDLGFERAGMECRWQVEIQPKRRAVLETYWPEVQRYEDIKECGSHNLEPVDCIAAGSPLPRLVRCRTKGRDHREKIWTLFRVYKSPART